MHDPGLCAAGMDNHQDPRHRRHRDVNLRDDGIGIGIFRGAGHPDACMGAVGNQHHHLHQFGDNILYKDLQRPLLPESEGTQAPLDSLESLVFLNYIFSNSGHFSQRNLFIGNRKM